MNANFEIEDYSKREIICFIEETSKPLIFRTVLDFFNFMSLFSIWMQEVEDEKTEENFCLFVEKTLGQKAICMPETNFLELCN